MRTLLGLIGIVIIMAFTALVVFQENNKRNMVYTQSSVCAEKYRAGKYTFLDVASSSGIVIPGLEQNFIPQGIAYWREKTA